jgi:signal transduction histidine kinase
VLAGAALVSSLAGAVLLASAAPYLSPLAVWPLPVVAAAFAAVAVYLTRARLRSTHLAALLLAAFSLAAPALSLGVAQDTGLWVAVGALAGLAVPAVAWVCLLTLRAVGAESLDQKLVVAGGALVTSAAVVRVATYDPAAWGWCRCATNPLALTGGPEGFLRLQPWTTAAHLAAVGLVVYAVGRSFWGRPGRLGVPEVALVGGLLVAAGSWAVGDLAILGGTPTDGADRGLGVGLVAVLVVHSVGVMRRRPSRAHVADLLLAARERSDPARLRELVARAIGDPGAAVYWWDPDSGGYVDHAGHPAPAAAEEPPERVLEVESDHRPIARVVGERPLVDDPGVLGPVAEALRLSTENRLLQEELAASLVQVRESRSRIVRASDDARRRIERDLHDGAQQLLISTAVKLNLVSARIDPARDRELAAALTDASDQLGRALDELRTLARGITPTALVHGSLPDALEDLALRSPVPAALRVEGSTALMPEVAATAYFVVAECLVNVAKHSGATTVQLHVELADALRIEVRDDGHGGADPSAGSGLKGLADRVEALGGMFEVQSSGSGTTVEASLPNKRPEAPS